MAMPPPPPVSTQPRKKRHILRWALLAIVAITVIGALAGPKDDDKQTASSAANAASPPASGVLGEGDEIDDVMLTSCEPSAGGSLVEARGTIVNNSSKTSDYSIDVSYVRSDGTVLDSNGIAFVQNVPAGGRAEWDTAFFQEPEAGASCKVTEVHRTASV